MEDEPEDPVDEFTKECKRGHVYSHVKRRCPECIALRNKKWRANNMDVVRRINRDSYHRGKRAE